MDSQSQAMAIVDMGATQGNPQGFGGPMGLTPSPSPAAPGTPVAPGTPRNGPPTGNTPSAKRPRAPEDVPDPAASAALSLQELTDGFTALHGQCAIERGQLVSTGQAVTWNADLLNALVLRVNSIEIQVPVLVPKTVELDSNDPSVLREVRENLNRLNTMVPQVEKCFDYVREVDKEDDRNLRDQIDTTLAKVDKVFEELKQRIGVVERVAAAATQSGSYAEAPRAASPLPGTADQQRQIDGFSDIARQAREQALECMKGLDAVDKRVLSGEASTAGLLNAVSNMVCQ